MNRTVILSPHHDDVALFTAFNAIRYRAHIVVVFRSMKQEADGITDGLRVKEESQAAGFLGCTVEFWPFPDVNPDWREVGQRIAALEAEYLFAPAPEDEGGNEQHNIVGKMAFNRHSNVTEYLTYTNAGKSTWGRPVEFEPAWVPMKLRALACHVSQASLPSCLPHFLREQTEYVA